MIICFIFSFFFLFFFFFFFFFNDTATTEIYTLSLHDALPISRAVSARRWGDRGRDRGDAGRVAGTRSEEHTSELQSHVNLVCRLLLEKKKKNKKKIHLINIKSKYITLKEYFNLFYP